jgi:hypothetical protein
MDVDLIVQGSKLLRLKVGNVKCNTLESKDEDLYVVQSINMASNGVVNKPTVSEGYVGEPTVQTGVVENAPIAEPMAIPKRQYNRCKPLNK